MSGVAARVEGPGQALTRPRRRRQHAGGNDRQRTRRRASPARTSTSCRDRRALADPGQRRDHLAAGQHRGRAALLDLRSRARVVADHRDASFVLDANGSTRRRFCSSTLACAEIFVASFRCLAVLATGCAPATGVRGRRRGSSRSGSGGRRRRSAPVGLWPRVGRRSLKARRSPRLEVVRRRRLPRRPHRGPREPRRAPRTPASSS